MANGCGPGLAVNTAFQQVVSFFTPPPSFSHPPRLTGTQDTGAMHQAIWS